MNAKKKPRRKSVAIQIAEHFGSDVADIRDYDYQPGTFTPKVYAGMDGNNYWSAGARQPRERDGVSEMDWQQVKSNYPGNGPLWRASKIKGDA